MKKRILSIASTIVLGFSIASAQTEPPIKTISAGVINGKAQTLAKPAYPAAARAVKAEGAVNVQVVIDETGTVVSATAISGHPLLRQAAEQAALQSKFAPTTLQSQPVKVSGIIVYNFVGPAVAENWAKVGYDLASFEKFANVNTFSLNILDKKIPTEWASERGQLEQLGKFAGANKLSAPMVAGSAGGGIKSEENNKDIVMKTGDDVTTKKLLIVRSTDIPAEASAEQVSIVQNLTSSVQSRLGSDPKAAWEFNLGVALGRAFSNPRNPSEQPAFVDGVRQQISSAPGDVAPEYLAYANKILAILESKTRTPEERQQIGGLLNKLFRN